MASEDLFELPPLSVTTLSQYVRLRNCDRFLRLRLRPEEEKALLRRWDLTIQPLTPLLKESGEAFEREVEERIAAEGYRVERIEEDDFAAITRWLRRAQGASEPIALLQVPLEARLGSYRCNGVADVVRLVPHRAQRALLSSELFGLATHEAIDTVERFQGGERDVIIVSATASDPDFVLSEAEFLLDSNRLNVVISRPRKKLVVIASRSITSLLISDLETFERALVWKQLYHRCTRETLWEGRVKGHKISVRGCPV